MSEAPKHAFEVRLVIGGNTWNYVLRAVDDMRQHLEDCGENCGMASGGWDGTLVVPDKMELKDWAEIKDYLSKPPVTIGDLRIAVLALIRAEMDRKIAKTE